MPPISGYMNLFFSKSEFIKFLVQQQKTMVIHFLDKTESILLGEGCWIIELMILNDINNIDFISFDGGIIITGIESVNGCYKITIP